MQNSECPDRRLVDRGVEACQDNTAEQLKAGTVRMGVIEERLGKHTELLEKTTALTVGLNKRFDNFESSLNVERREKEEALARSLDKWKDFMILKVDEATASSKVIGDKQTLHMKATEEVLAGLGDVLAIVSVMQGVKKTAGRFGRCGLWLGTRAGRVMLWLGGLAAAWIAIRTALTANVKIQWPWL